MTKIEQLRIVFKISYLYWLQSLHQNLECSNPALPTTSSFLMELRSASNPFRVVLFLLLFMV